MALIYITKVADTRAKIAPMRIKQAKKSNSDFLYWQKKHKNIEIRPCFHRSYLFKIKKRGTPAFIGITNDIRSSIIPYLGFQLNRHLIFLVNHKKQKRSYGI